MDITLFLSCFAKVFALLAFTWFLLTLVAYTFNRVSGEEPSAAIAGATEFTLWMPVWLCIFLALTRTEIPRSSLAEPEPAFEIKAGTAAGIVVYLCLSYLIKKRYEPQKS